MSETATLEAPAEVKPDTETVQPGDTEGEGAAEERAEATGAEAEAQAEETTEALVKAIAEGDEAEREAAIEAEVQKRLEQQKADAPKQAVKAKHQDALAKANELVADLGLDPDLAQPLFDLANAAHGEALNQAHVLYQDALKGAIPEAEQEAFDKKYASEPLDGPAYVKALVDWLMPKSIEDLTKRSAPFRKDLDKHLQAKYDEGRKQGRLDPSGEATGNERGAATKLTLAQIEAEPYAEWMSRPKEERDRLRADARSNQ